MATVLTISVIYSFYFPQIQALKESRPADSETHFQCMDVAAWGLTRGPYESMPGQIHEQKACFALSISAWFNGKCRGHFHTLHNFFSSGEEHNCSDRRHSPPAKRLPYLHPAKCFKLKAWLALPREYKRKTRWQAVTCHTRVPQLTPPHGDSLQREVNWVPWPASRRSSSWAGWRQHSF